MVCLFVKYALFYYIRILRLLLSRSKVGAFLSPYVVMSSLSNLQIGIILGIVNVVAACAAHCLPETTGTVVINLDILLSQHAFYLSHIYAYHRLFDRRFSSTRLSLHL